MVVATIAAYALLIVIILGLSVRFLWLFFVLFTYRTLSTLIPFEWFQKNGLDNHMIYFVVVLVISVAIYLLLIRLTMDLIWVRFVALLLMVVLVLYRHGFQDVFLFRDYLEANGMWNIKWYQDQLKEIFTTGPDGFLNLFKSVGDNVFSIFEKMYNGLSQMVK